MPDSVFGLFVSPGQIEKATLALLEKYFPTYLREVERQVEWDGKQLPAPVNYSRRNSFDTESGELLPICVVISPGLFDQPRLTTDEKGDSYYEATWQIGIGIATSAPNEEMADDMAKMYGVAARLIMLHHQDLEADIGACGTTWIDENYDDLETDGSQIAQFRAAQVDMGVTIETAASRWGGPALPSEAEQLIEEVETVITEVNDELVVTTT